MNNLTIPFRKTSSTILQDGQMINFINYDQRPPYISKYGGYHNFLNYSNILSLKDSPSTAQGPHQNHLNKPAFLNSLAINSLNFL